MEKTDSFMFVSTVDAKTFDTIPVKISFLVHHASVSLLSMQSYIYTVSAILQPRGSIFQYGF